MRDAQQYAAEDSRFREQADARNRLEQLLYNAQAIQSDEKNTPRSSAIP